jgi:hypothetical protein
MLRQARPLRSSALKSRSLGAAPEPAPDADLPVDAIFPLAPAPFSAAREVGGRRRRSGIMRMRSRVRLEGEMSMGKGAS